MYGRSMPFVWPIDGIGQSMYGPTMTFGWSTDVIGIAGATLTTLCWLPQALKVIGNARVIVAGDRTVHSRRLTLARLWTCHRGLAAYRLKRGEPILAMKLRYG